MSANLYLRLIREHISGLLLLLIVLIISIASVKVWKTRHPGAMSVLESQAMDMSVMKPPVGLTPVATEVVRLGAFTAKVTYTGSVAPFQQQVIYPRVEGWLKSVSVYNGAKVSANQLIAVVDSPDLQSKVKEAAAGHAAAADEIPVAEADVARMTAERSASQTEIQVAKNELSRANAALSASQKAVAQHEEEVKSAKARFDYEKAEIARQEQLYKVGAIALRDVQSQRARSTTAEADLANKKAALEAVRANVEASRADVATSKTKIRAAEQKAAAASAAVRAASHTVKRKASSAQQAAAAAATASVIDQYRYIRAPFAGSVTQRTSSPGQFVTPSTPIVDIVQIDQVRLQANVSDMDLRGIEVGAPVVARFDKRPSLVLNANVTSIAPAADQASRTAVVEAIVSNPDHQLIPGDSVTLDIAVSTHSTSISVPQSAIVQKNGMPAVWVVREGASKGKTEYTCTMHPEVISDKPGDCPKCHMKLVPKQADGNKKAHLVTVTTGASEDDRVQVLTGLSDGDEVIYLGNTYLKEGEAVFPTKWGEDGPEEMPDAPGMEDMPGHDMGSMSDHGDKPAKAIEKTPKVKKSTKKPAAKKVSKPATSEKLYECPMHPEETTHNPKDGCPICGMYMNQEVKK